MKNSNIIKNLTILTISALILLIITVYMSFEINHVNTKLEITKNTLATTQNELSSVYESLSAYQENFAMAREDLIAEQDKNTWLKSELDSANATIADLKNIEYKLVYIGNFKYTYYCDEQFPHICGYGLGLTASGKPTEVGWTVAADTSVLPMGSIIYVEGIGFREVMDVGGSVSGNHIDILMSTHGECYEQTMVDGGVWLLIKKDS